MVIIIGIVTFINSEVICSLNEVTLMLLSVPVRTFETLNVGQTFRIHRMFFQTHRVPLDVESRRVSYLALLIILN